MQKWVLICGSSLWFIIKDYQIRPISVYVISWSLQLDYMLLWRPTYILTPLFQLYYMCESITENQVAWVDSQLPAWLCVFHLRIVACARLSSGLSLGVPPPWAELNKDFWGAEHMTL